jgi:hypothetical protein
MAAPLKMMSDGVALPLALRCAKFGLNDAAITGMPG